MKSKFKNYFMRIANETAGLSHARRLQVGAIIVKDDRIISIGYNGMPAGWDNDCEDEISFPDSENITLKTKPEVLHAERNALDKLAKGNEGGLGSTMFITHAPCLECAKSIYGAGISQVFYSEDYRAEEGIDFLKKCGVNIEKLSTSDK
jgi:dCMP deaminase